MHDASEALIQRKQVQIDIKGEDTSELEDEIQEEIPQQPVKDNNLQLPGLERTKTQRIQNESMQRRYINESLMDLVDEGTYAGCLECFISFDENYMMPFFKRDFKTANRSNERTMFD